MSDWEDTFTSWAKGPGTTEQAKCEHAESAIRKALAANERLADMDISVFAQGSYRNRTNVKQDSDVDICVRLNTTFFPEYPPGKTREDFGIGPGSITFRDYKSLVETALRDYFGSDTVHRGNKAFDIHANTYRVDADVVATFEHRRYSGGRNPDGSHHYLSGIGFNTDGGKLILNWPDQAYDNGVQKHTATGRRYKKLIRIFKRLRNLMQEERIPAAENIASCLIDALVWNVPDDRFGAETYGVDVRSVLAITFNATLNDETCSEWREASELKFLFRGSQPWTREQAHAFLSAAWDYLGFE